MREGWDPVPRTCLTIHNLAYLSSRVAYELTNLPGDYFHPNGPSFSAGMNCLKAGTLRRRDHDRQPALRAITTEVRLRARRPLRQRQHSLVGIPNGVDYEE